MFARFIRPASTRLISPTIPRIARPMSSSSSKSYEHILVSTPRPGVGQITLNRPKVNTLNTPLMTELNYALRAFDDSKETGAIVITGSERAFAAGADIKEMQNLTFSEAYGKDFIKLWSDVTQISKPLIAAVNGHALGGGCELAMMADIIYCGPKATFGQPEIKLGIIPGAGGSQRLVRAIGKAKAMELILTGKTFSAEEAERWGLAARVFETPEKCVEGALETAEIIAGYGALSVKAAKEVVNQSYEVGLSEGVKYERRVFHALFATKDQKVGMTAFVNKTKPEWTGE
ncbi:ECH-domain-containing protein [Choiromyces venosus 120613-1]|uniref:Probable enoyl-CoA hydratase, mitochondrial n=1 Tax=Choiromyces venosus 120613-1 TaxID=1336337 RepID=A0A3N4JIH5_9PEZI|nr:ECH-domain-containing protein [Choiromyces venosus 120613-1]